MPNRFNPAVADDDIGCSIENRTNQFRDVASVVLVVRIGIDYDVRASLQRMVDTVDKCLGQSLVVGQLQDMIDIFRSGDIQSFVRTAVIDHQGFDDIDSFDLPGQFVQRGGKGFFFIQTGDLNNQFHGENDGVTGWRMRNPFPPVGFIPRSLAAESFIRW